jgi:DNA topoisomerase II
MPKSVPNTIQDELSAQYEKKTHLEHIKDLPDTYIGSVEPEVNTQWLVDNDFMEEERDIYNEPIKFVKKEINYSPGLKNIIEEILVNAYDNKNRVDQKIRQKVKGYKQFAVVTNIKVNVNRDEGVICIENDGEGIPVIKHSTEKIWIPQMIFGELLTSGNYNKNEEKITGGKNGYGAKLTNIFSTYFKVETVDRVNQLKYTQIYRDNMTVKEDPIVEKYKDRPFTRITFKPDFEKFGTKKMSKDFVALIEKRAYDMFACSRGSINVTFNNQKVPLKSFMEYVSLYFKDNDVAFAHCRPNDRWEIGACLSPIFSFQQVSFVNGINTSRGGRHVDYIVKQVTKKLAEIIRVKSKKIIKESFIKDNLMVFVNSTIVNPKFDSQTKETLTTNQKDFGSTCELTDEFIKKIGETGIMERAIALSEFKDNANLKKTDGKKKNKIMDVEKLEDAYHAGRANADKCTIILTEGDSAKAMAVAGLSIIGRDYYGVFPLRGKLINTMNASDADVAKNKEIADLKKIIGLQEGKNYNDVSDLRYGKIMIMTDQDADGSHIKGLIMNFIAKWTSLMKMDGFICSLLTPIVKVWKGSNKQKAINFYTLTEYEDWLQRNNGGKGYNTKYYKGLGTSTPSEAKEYFKEFKVANYHWDDETIKNIDLAFNKSRADDRKTWLSAYNRDNIIDLNQSYVTFSDFIHKELIHFSNSDNNRSIPNFIDGLKVSQRKILYCAFKRKLDKEIRVAQLAGYVSENGAYHHGEASLHGTIINLAQNYCNSNNINLFVPEGQFGTRLKGGKDSAQPRYIHTYLTNIANVLYDKRDEPLLKDVYDDGLKVEPFHYIPILPTILINGSEGIGTGWSNFIPKFNVLEIIDNIKNLMEDRPIEEMKPWFRGFKGQIKTEGKNKWVTKGIYKILDTNTVAIEELPIGTWTDNYKIFLDQVMQMNDIKPTITNKAKGKIKKVVTLKNDVNKILKDYKNESTDSKVKFILKFDNANLMNNMLTNIDKSGINDFERKFKLVGQFSCTRTLNVYDEQSNLKSFTNIEDILTHYYNVRLHYYDLRKKHMANELRNKLKLVSVKVQFIEDIINKKIKINNVPKAELIEQLTNKKYPKMLSSILYDQEGLDSLKKADRDSASYDYLIKLPIYSLTKEKIEELKAEKGKFLQHLSSLDAKTIKQLWLDDIEVFEKEYKGFMNNYYKYNDLDSKEYPNRRLKRKTFNLTKK